MSISEYILHNSLDMPKRGINYKKILITVDQETLDLLRKYKSWGTPISFHVRRAIKQYEMRKKPSQPKSWDGVDVIYD